MKNIKAFFAVALLALAGCAQLGIQPQTFNDRVGVAIATVTSVRDTSTKLALAKKITVEDKINVEKQADNAREAIGIAVSLHKTNVSAGENKLDLAVVVLQKLSDYLATKQVN